jgi:hypothetical protein
LASVNSQALARVHPGQQVEYRYKFSEIPFAGQPVAQALADALRSNPHIDHASKEIFARALSDEDSVTHIDIFGSYPNYSPLVFDSVLRPAGQQWAEVAGPARSQFWRYRRSRPLQAALPMGDAERRTMTAGWLLGQVVGRIQIPESPYMEPVRIFDGDAGQWLSFPSPLLTPPSNFIASYDWLPAVLEGILLAIAQSQDPPVMRSLRPYEVLRALYDANSQDPAGGIVQLSGVGLLRDFILNGWSAPDLVSRIEGIAAAQTPTDRAVAAEEWLSTVRDISAEYLPPGAPGVPTAGAFARIATRSKAAKTPIFRDLAPDVFWAAEMLIKFVRQVKASAVDGQSRTAAVILDEDEQVVIPDGGTF